MQITTTPTQDLVLSLLEVNCNHYTGWNIVPKVHKKVVSLFGTDGCLLPSFACI